MFFLRLAQQGTVGGDRPGAAAGKGILKGHMEKHGEILMDIGYGLFVVDFCGFLMVSTCCRC